MYNGQEIGTAINAKGWAVLPSLVDPFEANAIASLYEEDALFRSTVVMARHGFGRGAYRYFRYLLPASICDLRTGLYPSLAAIANRWQERAGKLGRFPANHADYLAACHAAGQCRPTPLLLQYGPGDYNCLHQDLYGEEVFPLQAAVLLDAPGEDFEGGELILTEQRPRMQSRAMVVPLRKGDAVVFAVSGRPRAGGRGDYQVKMHHGVSEVLSGRRRTLGLIFHDAA